MLWWRHLQKKKVGKMNEALYWRMEAERALERATAARMLRTTRQRAEDQADADALDRWETDGGA